jgi:hypothetical protein
MSEFRISVYQTKQLTNYCNDQFNDEYRAQQNVKTYIESYNYTKHYVTVNTPSFTAGAPTENVYDSFSAKYPCDRTFTVDYTNLVQWWKDYVQCELSESQDADLLLTDSDSGGGGLTLNNQYSASGTGARVAAAPTSYSEYGCGSDYDGIQGAMHEVGHAFLDNGSEWEHEAGYVYDHGGTYYRTPMGYGGDIGYGSCDQYVSDTHDENCNQMHWYENCSVENWVHTG